MKSISRIREGLFIFGALSNGFMKIIMNKL
jgi:hypothetical protein